MDSPLSSNQGTLTIASEASSLASLLERGLHCTQQGYFAEGVTYFALARERLSPDQKHFAVVLDELIQIHASYLQAQQALHVASKRFVKADADQQAQLVALEKLLLIPGEDTHGEPAPHTAAQSPENSWSQQPPPSPQLLLADSSTEKLPQPLHSSPRDGDALPALCFTCFGRFEVRRVGRLIALCPSRSGQRILRYLVAQPGHSATIDSLMAMLWPEDEQEVAQPKLHIAISALRRSLSEGHVSAPSYIVCKNRSYYLNPEATIKTDVDEFLQCNRAGRLTEEGRMALYEQACRLYTGPFLSEDLYADWSFLQREQLSRTYLAMCRALTEHYLKTSCYEEAEKWAMAVLKENRCDEAAHRHLIQIYAVQGRRSEALRQYQRCERVLREELGVQPLTDTQILFQALLANDPLHQ